ncbi:hypothetical protein D9M68_785620 [compost metagenome]
MIAQIGIALFGVIAVWLSQAASEDQHRYACLFGMASQPFWFYSAYSAEQWGILGLCVLYAASWLRGFNQHWLRPWRARANAEEVA